MRAHSHILRAMQSDKADMLAERAILKDKARDDAKKARAAAVKVADCIFNCIFKFLCLMRP